MAQARRDEIAPRSAELKNRGQQRRCASKDEKRETVGDSKQALLAANNEHKVVLFGFDLSHLPSNTQFFFCVGGVFTFNVLYGYLQELLAVTVAGRKFALFLAACQFAGYAFWSHVLARLNRSITRQHTKELALQRDTPKVPMNKFVGLSLLRAFDLAITNSAMQFLNYPAKTLIKSCRVVFTMFMGVLMLGKRYKPKDYVAVFTLVIGLGIFLHADSTTSAVFHPLGVLLLTVSLVCDGTLNNWSEQMMDQYSLSQDDFHSRLYGVSLLATVVAAFCSDELLQGIDMFLMQPGTIPEIESGATEFTWSVSDKAIALLAFSTSGIMGASCLGAITKRFGCLSMALTSTARKATTLFLSFALFHNNCTPEHLLGVTLFMAAMVMKTLFKNGHSSSKSIQTGGESPEEAATISNPFLFKISERLQSVLRSIGLGPRESTTEMASILRKRSSIEMDIERGISTD